MFSSNSDCATQSQGRDRNGFLKLRRGRLERNAPDGEPAWNYEHAMRALGPIVFCAFLYVLDRTLEAYKPRPAVDIDEEDLADVLRVSVRQVRSVIAEAIEAGAITRDPEHYWRLSAHVECLETLPARAPRVHANGHKKPCRPKQAEMRAPVATAALTAPTAPAAVGEIHFPEPMTERAPEPAPEPTAPAAVGEIHFPEREANFRPRETYCPWNWSCPHLVSGLPDARLSQTVDISPTTTADPRIAYLARFLNAPERIGDELQIDDVAAARMWTESAAVNRALTPREFLLIARMKLQEWRRVDDARPGLKVRRIVGLLIRSMPAAVQGALYLAAHEQAPDDLARDCSRAREILAGNASPRDRAWATGILAEAGTET